jgi:hypothetical protein
MSSRQLRRTRSATKNFYPTIESLEARENPAVDFVLAGDTLSITQVGLFPANDIVNIVDDGKGGLKVTANFKNGGFSTKDFTAVGPISTVNLNLKGGKDTVNYALTGVATKNLTINGKLGTLFLDGNDSFKADLGNNVLKANRTFDVDGREGNDTFAITNVGNVGNAADSSATPPVAATTPTLRATFNGGDDKDTATVTLNGDIFGTVDLTFNGQGDGSLFKTLDNFTLNAKNDVDIAKGGKLSVSTTRANATIDYQGEVDGNIVINSSGNNGFLLGGRDTLKATLTADADTNKVGGGDITGTLAGRGGNDDLTFLVFNNSGANGLTTVTNAVADGGAGIDTGLITGALINAISIEKLSKV